MKSCSSIKKAMRQWNLYEWYCHYDVLVNSYVSKTKKNIETTILKGNGWCSRYVAEWLNTSLKESTIFHVVNQKPNEHHKTRFIRGTTYCLKKKCFLN